MPREYSSKTAPGAGDEQILSTEGAQFTLDGTTFTCHGTFDAQDFIDLAGPLMESGEGWYDPEALAAVSTFYRTVMGEESYRRFAAHRRRHRTPPTVVAHIMTDLIEELTQRPPDKPSASPPGPPRTAPSSPAGPPPPASRVRYQAQDPEGIIPPEWAGSGDVMTAPAPPPPAGEEDPLPGTHRTVNLGDPARTKVEPLYPG